MELAGGEVRELVAEDFVEEGVSVSVGRLGDVGGDADETAVGIAPAEGAGEAGESSMRVRVASSDVFQVWSQC